MKRDEMTPEQLGRRDAFARRLLAARWDDGGWEELFRDGLSLTPEARAEYQSAAFNLRLGYHAGADYVSLECVGRADPTELSLRLYPRGNLEVILDKLIAAQDVLSPDNYPGFVKELIPLCDPLLLETPDGLVQLS